MEKLAHPTGLPFPRDFNDKRRLTTLHPATEIRRVPRLMANRSGAPPSGKSKAPDPAATGSSAKTSFPANVRQFDTTATRTRIGGTLGLRFGGAA